MNSSDPKTDDLITFLYRHVTTFKDAALIKDTTKISKIKFDAYLDSSVTRPLSFTVFELSDKGELVIDDVQKLAGSEAAFFLFINPAHGWIFAIKNTSENQKRLIRKEPVQNYKVKILE